jgi:hypothetical protein
MRETACAGGTIGNRGVFVKVDRPVKKLDKNSTLRNSENLSADQPPPV